MLFFILFSLPFYETHGIRICSIRSRFILHWNLLKFSFAWFSIYCSLLSNRITDPMNDFRCEENIYRYRSHINFYDKIHWKPVPLLSSPLLCALLFSASMFIYMFEIGYWIVAIYLWQGGLFTHVMSEDFVSWMGNQKQKTNCCFNIKVRKGLHRTRIKKHKLPPQNHSIQ